MSNNKNKKKDSPGRAITLKNYENSNYLLGDTLHGNAIKVCTCLEAHCMGMSSRYVLAVRHIVWEYHQGMYLLGYTLYGNAIKVCTCWETHCMGMPSRYVLVGVHIV